MHPDELPAPHNAVHRKLLVVGTRAAARTSCPAAARFYEACDYGCVPIVPVPVTLKLVST